MIPITEIAKGIFRIGPLETGYPSAATSPYLVVGSERSAIVEPGEDGQALELLEGIKLIGVPLDNVAYIVATHIHMHHIQGVPRLLKNLSKATFLVHPRGAPHVIEPTRFIQSTLEAWGDKCYGPFEAIPRERVMAVQDGQVFDLGGRELEILHTPGHAPHHIAIFDRLTRALWAGDVVVGIRLGGQGGMAAIVPPRFDVEQYVQTMRRLRDLKPSMLLIFGSGAVSHTPDRALQVAEEGILATERICLEGMRQKTSFKEISRKVAEYRHSVGVRVDEREMPEAAGGGPFGMIAYLRRKYPELDVPSDLTPRMRQAFAAEAREGRS